METKKENEYYKLVMEVMEIKKVSMPRHTLTKFEIQTCYQNGLRF